MASTITLTGDWLANLGSINRTQGTGNIGVYVTGGIAITAAQVGLGVIDTFNASPTSGYTFQYVASTGKLKAYVSAGFTPAGTNTAPTITAAGTHTTNTLSRTAGGAVALADDSTTTGITGVQAPVFAGTAVAAAALSEVASTTDLSSVVFGWTATGR